MAIEQPRQHGLPVQIDDASLRTTLRAQNFFIATRAHDAVTPDRNRLLDRKARINRQYLGIMKNEVGIRTQTASGGYKEKESRFHRDDDNALRPQRRVQPVDPCPDNVIIW